MDSSSQDDSIKFTWNSLPSNTSDMTKIIIPVGFHYTPIQRNENMDILEYDPLTCPNCKSIISPFFSYNVHAKIWNCPFCNTKVYFPKVY